MDPVVEFIARQDGMAERLLAIHVDDGNGYCAACPLGGQAGFHAWPCTIHNYATRARDSLRADRPAR